MPTRCLAAARFSFCWNEEVPLRIRFHWMAVIGLLGPATSAHADYELVMKKNCTACHYVDKRKYGPSLQQVAAKYADQKDAADLLAKKIMSGGTGVWGEDVMPPQPQVSASEARTIATYVLSLK